MVVAMLMWVTSLLLSQFHLVLVIYTSNIFMDKESDNMGLVPNKFEPESAVGEIKLSFDWLPCNIIFLVY